MPPNKIKTRLPPNINKERNPSFTDTCVCCDFAELEDGLRLTVAVDELVAEDTELEITAVVDAGEAGKLSLIVLAPDSCNVPADGPVVVRGCQRHQPWEHQTNSMETYIHLRRHGQDVREVRAMAIFCHIAEGCWQLRTGHIAKEGARVSKRQERRGAETRCQ